MKTIFIAIALVIAFTLPSVTQDNTVTQIEIAVSGNCNRCKARIESALKIKGVKFAKWDKKSKSLTLAYIPSVISLDSLEHRIALAGHDTEKFKTPDSIYSELPPCCLYRADKN
ncbi:MAG: ATPase [Bacteroidota bacterium]